MSQLPPVAVIGLGMIGGSVARELAAIGVEVIGCDSNQNHLDAAIAEGIVARGVNADLCDLCAAQIAVIAVDVDSAHSVLARLEASGDKLMLVTDVGSTKRSIVAAAERSKVASSFVGSHPFAGDHRSGWSASRGGLFANELVYLSPTTFSSLAAIECAQELWKALGAKPVMVDAAEHDALLAWTSHLPHFVSIAFALASAEAEVSRKDLGRGGRDIARLSAGSVDMWAAIAFDNRDEILKSIDSMRHQIDDISAILSAADRIDFETRLRQAREWSIG